MTDTALTNRLRQQSRRAGLMVGVTMALTIGICIAGFAGIFSVLAPFTRDFIDEQATAQPSATTAATAAPNATQPPAPAGAAEVELTAPPEPEPTQPPQPTAAAIVPRETVTGTSTTFRATHTSNARFSINLRSEPNTSSQVVAVLQPSTQVQFLEERTGTGATDWLRFRTEQGDQGWIRQIDVDPIAPGA
jgi:hypothetical protein